ncbi:MAG: hypothetical protein R3D25_20425 [Geminicoccaceae bacterium]
MRAALTLTAAIGGAFLAHMAIDTARADENAAEKAVEAAKQYSGITLNSAEEAGLDGDARHQHHRTGMGEAHRHPLNVTEIPFEELFPKQMLEHKAGSGAYDVLTIGPSWVADM